MYSAPSGYPRFSAAIDTCPIQSCNRFTASPCRPAISDLMSVRSLSAASQCELTIQSSVKAKPTREINPIRFIRLECDTPRLVSTKNLLQVADDCANAALLRRVTGPAAIRRDEPPISGNDGVIAQFSQAPPRSFH